MMMNYLRSLYILLRLPNLLILGITMYLIFHYIIYPPLVEYHIVSKLTGKDIWGLIFIVLCIGAGGYVYNDIIDVQSDAANDKRGVVGQGITIRLALAYYLFLTIAPLLPLAAICGELESWSYLGWYSVFVGSLWLYNQYLMKLPLLGNLMVAILCGWAMALPYLIEIDAIQQLRASSPISYNHLRWKVLGFSSFAFMANVIREMIKDLEDMEGDLSAGYRTMPIRQGSDFAKRVINVFSFAFVAMIIAWTMLSPSNLTFQRGGICVLLVSAIFWLSHKLRKASQMAEFYSVSLKWKTFFLLGIASFFLMS